MLENQLLSVLTSAKPKLLPFTTLKPNLGIVAYRDFQSFVIADIPGIMKVLQKVRIRLFLETH
jgi:GTP-binding protein